MYLDSFTKIKETVQLKLQLKKKNSRIVFLENLSTKGSFLSMRENLIEIMKFFSSWLTKNETIQPHKKYNTIFIKNFTINVEKLIE